MISQAVVLIRAFLIMSHVKYLFSLFVSSHLYVFFGVMSVVGSHHLFAVTHGLSCIELHELLDILELTFVNCIHYYFLRLEGDGPFHLLIAFWILQKLSN